MGQELKLTESAETRRGEVWHVVHVWGEPMAFNIDPLDAVLVMRSRVAGTRLLVRFEDAHRVDSTAFAMLMKAFMSTRQGGGRFRLEVSERLEQLLRLVGSGGGDDELGGVLAPLAPPPPPRRSSAAAEPPVDTGE